LSFRRASGVLAPDSAVLANPFKVFGVVVTLLRSDWPLEALEWINTGSVSLVALYRKRAKWYDRESLFLYLSGSRHWAYRKRASQSLALNQGDTVMDLGCGTGLNFSLLQEQVGPRGRIIGVDLTDTMLDEATARIAAHGWANVQLVTVQMAVLAMDLRPRASRTD
jgi:SAM-dependent methyltransferase